MVHWTNREQKGKARDSLHNAGYSAEDCRIRVYNNIASICFSFGKRTGNSNRRAHDCLVLEASEMIVVSACLLTLWGVMTGLNNKCS